MQILLLIFIILLLFAGVEFYFFSRFIDFFGFWQTLFLVIGTGILGAYIAKKNAKVAITNLKNGNLTSHPAKQLFDAIIFFLAAILLIIPGIITDALGFLLLIPFVRSIIFLKLANKITTKVKSASNEYNRYQQTNSQTIDDNDYIDIEAEDETDK